ncbi:SSI family serine proteinase inhibitor [Streptomyces sp. NPDC050418]|uniref:SSI family serine proteinase inhibitor n=1 Tax=Streptomyces sp. NPDC050418 TaxID=3365612 RepID=UPI0037B86E74
MTTSARTTAVKALCATAAAGALLIGAAGAAAADHAPDRAPALPGNWMFVGVMQGDAELGDLDGRLLNCPPGPGTTHPDADAACRTLDRVDGEIADIRPREIACPMIYKPVTAVAYGMWDGTRRTYSKTFANDCAMNASTGGVFDFAG